MKHLTHHQFSASVDGVLQSVPARLMESHLASCAACRGRWDGFLESQETLSDLLRHDGTPEFHARLAETLGGVATEDPPPDDPSTDDPPPGDPSTDDPPPVDILSALELLPALELQPAIDQAQAPDVLTPTAFAVPDPPSPSPAAEGPPPAKRGSGRHMTHHQLSASLDGELVGVSAQLVERHLDACEPCRHRREGFRHTRGVMVELLHHTAVPGFPEDLERVLGVIATKGSVPARFAAGPTTAPTPVRPAPVEPPAAGVPGPASPAAPPVAPPVIGPEPAPKPRDASHEAASRRAAPIDSNSRRTPAVRRLPDRGEDAALSRAWMATAFLVLAAVVWVSWMFWDYQRSTALAPATPLAPATTGAASSERAPAPPSGSRETDAQSGAAPGTASSALVPVVPGPTGPGAPQVEAPSAGHATKSDPALVPEPSAPPVEPEPPRPVAPRPAQPRSITPRHAAARADSRTTPVPKKAVVAPALGMLCGRVSDENHQPVVGARVLIADLQGPIATDRTGGFCVSAPVGEHRVSIVALGFETSRQVIVVGPQALEILVTLRAPAPADPPPN